MDARGFANLGRRHCKIIGFYGGEAALINPQSFIEMSGQLIETPSLRWKIQDDVSLPSEFKICG